MKGPSLRHQRARPHGKPVDGFSSELKRRFGIALENRKMWPDAYEFEEAKKTLRLYEVIVTHELTAEKLEKLRWLRTMLSAQGWRLRLVAAAVDGKYRNVDMNTGDPIITWREKAGAVARLPPLWTKTP